MYVRSTYKYIIECITAIILDTKKYGRLRMRKKQKRKGGLTFKK